VGAELVPLDRVEGPFQERAEDGGLDVLPLLARCFDKQIELVAIDGQGRGVGEQAAVELQKLLAEVGGEAADVHVPPQILGHRFELGRVGERAEHVAEAVFGQQADIFGKHREQAAHKELRDVVWVVLVGLERPGECGELSGDFARDFRAAAGRVERERVEPDGAEPVADRRLSKLVELDAV
jgi:hypothetical protein